MKSSNPILKLFFACILAAALISCSKEEPLRTKVLTEEVKSALVAAAEEIFTKSATPGLIALISVEGEPDFLIKRGTSNIQTGEPIHEDNAFRIASVTKTFTGTAVLILADEGLIALDAPISDYLPEYNIPSGDAITVRMLGNMTSGLYNYTDSPYLSEVFLGIGFTTEFSPDSLLAMSFREPLCFAPGTDYEYCNTNTVLLGLLLEKITGKPANQVLQERVCAPLNLNRTYLGGSFFLHLPYSHGYTMGNSGFLDATNWNPSWAYTAGAMISNTADMKKWIRRLADGALISEAMKAERDKFMPHYYGFGIQMLSYKSDRWLGHPGNIPGYNVQVWHNPEKDISLIIYSNTDEGGPAQNLLIEYITLFGDM